MNATTKPSASLSETNVRIRATTPYNLYVISNLQVLSEAVR